MFGFFFCPALDLGCYIISIAKTVSKKIGALIRFMKFLSAEVALYLYINLPYGYAWNFFVISDQVLLAATWDCWISYRNRYVGLLVLHQLPLSKPWLIVERQTAFVFSVGITLVDVYQTWLNWFHFLILVGGLLVILINCMIFLSPFLDVASMSLSTVFFLAQLDSGIPCL